MSQIFGGFTDSDSGGDVDGPASATNNDIVAFDGTTGKLIKDSGILYTNVVQGPASVADNTLARFDSTTGKLIQGGSVTVGDTGIFSGAIMPAESITGTATNDSAAAGRLGEYVESIVAAGSAIGSYSSNTPQNITSISLTAGDWDVTGALTWLVAAITGTRTTGRIGTVSANVGADGEISRIDLPLVPTAVSAATLPIPMQRFSLSGTTTIYLVSQITFSVGTPTACGYIRARRVR